jgi:iron only hydrogenase large subunit-like protein
VAVAQLGTPVIVSMAEMLGGKNASDIAPIIASVLHRIGFSEVFETSLGTDVMIREQATVLVDRIKNGDSLPLVTSSCPAWVQYAEQYYPDLLPLLSPLRSPAQVTGNLIKGWYAGASGIDEDAIVSILITSCTAAKSEARKMELTRSGKPVIDLVLTTRELARLIRLSGLDLDHLEPGSFSEPFRSTSTSGKLTGVAGGEAEATLRTAYFLLTGEEISPAKLYRFRMNKPYREMKVSAGNHEIRIGAVSGLSHALPLLEKIRTGECDLDLLEIMACPGGCINGGGQPLPGDESVLKARARTVYDIDNSGEVQTAHHDPGVAMIYEKFLGEPGSKTCENHLHTTFSPREGES